jgi:DNA-binding HxlR family transcriptional regulator
MEQSDIDLEIVNTVKNGLHHFGKIWEKVKGIGSKQTFSKHLTQLVKDDVIEKRMVKGKPEYWLFETEHLFKSKLFEDRIKEEINLIKNSKKKPSDKSILKHFIERTQRDLIFHSLFNFDNLLTSFESDKRINDKHIKLIQKLIKTRIDYLQKRDPELLIMFSDLVRKDFLNLPLVTKLERRTKKL